MEEDYYSKHSDTPSLYHTERGFFFLYLWFDSSLTSSYYFYQQHIYFYVLLEIWTRYIDIWTLLAIDRLSRFTGCLVYV